ncbi:hypothetical protein QQ045_030444 [Rhodiola kirilowii]
MAKRSWFTNHLAKIPADADEETLKKYARAYLICLIGVTLFIDKSAKTIPLYFLPLREDLDWVKNYSWGSEVLAYLYSNMCSAFGRLADPIVVGVDPQTITLDAGDVVVDDDSGGEEAHDTRVEVQMDDRYRPSGSS